MPFNFFTHKQKPILRFVSDESSEQRYEIFLHNIQYISTVLNLQFRIVLMKFNLEIDNYNRKQVEFILDKMDLANLLPTPYVNTIKTTILEQLKEDSITFGELKEKFSCFALNSTLLEAIEQLKFMIKIARIHHLEEEKKITECLKLILDMLCEPSEERVNNCIKFATKLSGHSSLALKALGFSFLVVASLLLVIGFAFTPAAPLLLSITIALAFGVSIASFIVGAIISLGLSTQHGLSKATTQLTEKSNMEMKRQDQAHLSRLDKDEVENEVKPEGASSFGSSR